MKDSGFKEIDWDGVDKDDLEEAVSAICLSRALEKNEDGAFVAHVGDQYINLNRFGEALVNREWNSFLFSTLAEDSNENDYDAVMADLLGLFISDQEIFKDRKIVSLKDSIQLENEINSTKERLKRHVNSFSKSQVLKAVLVFSDIKGFQNTGDDKILEIFGKEAYEGYRRNFSQEIHRYLLGLVQEGVLTEELIAEAGVLKYMEPEEILQLHQEGLISTKMIADSRELHRISKSLFKILIESGFFDNIAKEDVEMLRQMHTNGFFDAENIAELYSDNIISREDAIEILGGKQEVYSHYEAAKRSKNKRRLEAYYNLFGKEDIFNLYIRGSVDISDVEKVGIDKAFIEKLTEDEFLKLVQKGFPKGVQFESDELIEGYLSKYSGNTLIALAQNGYIPPEKLLSLIDIEITEENKERGLTAQNLLELYTPGNIIGMLADGKIDTDFIIQINEKLLSTLNEEDRAEYMKKIIDGSMLKMEKAQYAKSIFSMLGTGKIPAEYFENLNISENVLMDMYIEEELSEEQIVEYFNRGILNEKAIKIIYGEDYHTIIELIKSNTLSEKAAAIIPPEVLKEKLMSGDLAVKDIFDIYTKYGTISTSELSDMFEQYGNVIDKRVHIVSLIGEGFDVDKIKELYLYDILTHSDLLELQESGIITEEQCEEISKMDLAKFYKEIFDQNKRIENIYEESEAGEEKEKTERDLDSELPEIPKAPEVPSGSRKEFFKNLGAYDYQDIESFDSEGREAPFGNYKMLGFLDYGLAIFENFEQTRNATYVMTFQELKSYIIKEAEKSIVFKKSKQALREEIANGRAVRVCNHTVNWGNNVIEAMKQLSKDARENISEEQQQELASKIQEQYRLAKERQLEAEKAALEAARAKQNEVMKLERKTKEEYDKERGEERG